MLFSSFKSLDLKAFSYAIMARNQLSILHDPKHQFDQLSTTLDHNLISPYLYSNEKAIGTSNARSRKD